MKINFVINQSTPISKILANRISILVCHIVVLPIALSILTYINTYCYSERETQKNMLFSCFLSSQLLQEYWLMPFSECKICSFLMFLQATISREGNYRCCIVCKVNYINQILQLLFIYILSFSWEYCHVFGQVGLGT